MSIKVLNLGDFYISNFLDKNETSENREKYPLDLILDEEIGAARLSKSCPHDKMWGKYWYRSSTNNSMKNELRNIVEEISSRINYNDGDIWLDIACNDGTLLSFIPNKFIKLGIDPADDSFKNESSKFSDVVVQDYFNLNSYKSTGYGDKKCKVITTIAMFYDLEDPNSFIRDINEILDDDGLWVIQLSYTPLMLKQLAFDNICHEHFYYHSLNSLNKLFKSNSLKIVDANLNDTNGGSVRIYIQKDKASPLSFANAPLRDVCNFRVDSLLKYEENYFDISDPENWKLFEKNIEDLKNKTVSFIKQEKAKGKIIGGYGASTKGNTLLQLFGLDNSLIDFIAERSPYKYGLKTIGTEIPIISEDEMRKIKPDYLLVLPWHFINEFVSREKEYLESGGKFIVPCPTFEIISL
jgi:hypothetical protein